jgi:hypothetical protein
MPDFHRVFVNDDNFIRGAARLMWAAITQAFPTEISQIVNISTYEPMSGWNDLGATKSGVQITVNNTEETFDVDQIAGDIASEATAWEVTVGTQLAEMTLARLQLAWEGGTITTNTAPIGPDETNMGIGNPTSYTQRRIAVLHQRPNGKIRAYIFRKAQRTPQESPINFSKTGEQQSIPVRFRCLADISVANQKDRIAMIYDQV